MEMNCYACEAVIPENANFCQNCGVKTKCSNCDMILSRGAKFCNGCGNPIATLQQAANSNAVNSIKYKKNDNEISCEISFTDTVGKEGMNDLIAAIVNRSGGTMPAQIVNSGSVDAEYIQMDGDTGKVNPPNAPTEKTRDSKQKNDTSEDEPPHINDIENTIECTESEWIAVYAFYESAYGSKTFKGDAVRERYLAKRRTENRVKSYTKEWKKLFANTISTVKDNEYRFKSSGLEAVKKIILGEKKTGTEKSKKSKSSSSSAKKTPARSVEVLEFDIFNTNDKISLEELFTQKKPGDSTNDKILLIAYYITKINGEAYFNEGQIEYAYKALQLKERPNHLRQTINNIKNSKVWFKDHPDGGWTLERLGETYVDKMPKDAE